MRSKYRELGELIEKVDIRNIDGSINTLVGVSIEKCFIKSVANTIGTDLTKYKVIRRNEFAVSLMQVSRDEKIPVARLTEYDVAIMSPAYPIFKVKDERVILPEYLDMWFKRSEFDREASFIAVGGVRGSMPYEEFCRMKILVPSLEEQRRLVSDYQTITDRIAIKQRINDNLEATIEAMFRNYYSDISEDNCILLQELCELTSSKRVFADDYKDNGIPFYRGSEITLKHLGKPIISPLYISCEHYNALRKEYGVPQNGDILITAVGTIGNSYMVQNEDFYFKDGNIIWLRNFSKPNINYYIYDFMKSTVFNKILDGICIGSTQTALTIVSLSNVNVKIPDNEKLSYYTKRSKQIHLKINDNIKEIEQLQRIQSVLLSVLSR